jgi:hypothetical protein
MKESLGEFLFIVAVPLVLAASALVALFALGALFDALDHPGEIKARMEGMFRRPPKPPTAPGADHYYRAYWAKP